MRQLTYIHFSMQMNGEFIFLPTTEFDVPNDNCKAYGYPNYPSVPGCATVLDAVVEAHIRRLGDAFTPQTCEESLRIRADQWLAMAFGEPAYYSGFGVNGEYLCDYDGPYTRSGYRGLAFNQAILNDGDVVEVFLFEDSYGMDYYLYFLRNNERVNTLHLKPGERANLALEGLMFAYGGPMTIADRKRYRFVSRVAGAQLVTVDVTTGLMTPISGSVCDKDGNISISFDEPGTYYVSSTGGFCRYNSNLAHPWLVVEVE
jgi:hypothetical protein